MTKAMLAQLKAESWSWFCTGPVRRGEGMTDADHKLVEADGICYQYERLPDPASDYYRLGLGRKETT